MSAGTRDVKTIGRESTHVELRTVWRAGAVEGKHLRPQEIVARADALRDRDDMVALAAHDLLRSPDAVVEAVLLNLEPSQDVRKMGPL